VVHKGRQEIGILGNKTSVPQRSARSWPQRRRSFLVLFVVDAVVVISVTMIVILVTVMLFAKVAVVLAMSVVAVHAFGEFLEIA